MDKKVLSPHSEKKQRYALKAFLWGMAIIAAFIIPCMIMDNGMYIYFGDYNVEVLPFYELMSESIKSGNTGWSWYTDLGTSFVGAYSVVNLGSPFFWLLLPFPADWIPYLNGPLMILKFGVASLGAYIYLKRYVKNKNNAVLGGILYAYSGFAMYNLVFQFTDSIAFFPFMLAAMDSLVIDKKRGRFAFMVALSSLVNYYMFIGEAVFLVIYWLVRVIAKNFRYESIKEVVLLVFEGVLGVGMSLSLLLPSLYNIVGNTRLSETNLSGWNAWVYENVFVYVQLVISLFMPPEVANSNIYTINYSSSWAALTTFIALFGMSSVFAVFFNKRAEKWQKLFFAVCAVFMFVPILNSSFQMFAEAKYIRWIFMANLVMCLAAVTSLEDKAADWKKAIRLNLIITAAIIVIVGLTPTISETKWEFGLYGDKAMYWMLAAVAMANADLAALFIKLYRHKNKSMRKYCSAVMLAAVVISFASVFVPAKQQGIEVCDVVKDGMLNQGDEIHIDDIQQWRSDLISLHSYSMYRYDMDEVIAESMDIPEMETSNATYVDSLLLDDTKKKYQDDNNLNVFWRIPGFQSFHSTVNGNITRFFKGMGLTRYTASNWYNSLYGLRSFMSVKYLFNQEDDCMTFKKDNGEYLMPGWKYVDTQNGYEIYENEYCIPMGLTYDKFIMDSEFDKIPAPFRHLVLLDTIVIHDYEDMFTCTAMGMQQLMVEDCDYTREGYFENCEDRIASSCYSFERDNKGFEAKIKTEDNEEFVLFTVPYDNGWRATVNGEHAEIKLLDFGFMAVKVPANTDSTIRFDYHTPGVVYGIFVSIVCLFMLLIYMAALKVQSGAAQPDESESDKKDEEPGDNDAVAEKDEDDVTFFDIVKETEEQNMMHVYNRVPVVIEKGYGSTAWDIDDKKYIDFTSGIGVNALGYSDYKWSSAVEDQTYKLTHMSNLYYNTTQIQLAELLCMKTGFSKVFFANSGAEANECAIKLARKYGNDKLGKGKTHIVTLENSFHGRTITTLSATGQDEFHKNFEPFTEGFSYAKANDIESVKSKVTDKTCAVMIELVQGEGGVNPLDKDFVKQLSEFCKEKNILLIVDEIQTGMGRTGKLFCYENYEITPDVITAAKALGGGLPLSACMCSEALSDIMTAGSNGTTFGGNPIACAGAMVILDAVSDEDFLAEVREKGEYIRERISHMDGVKSVRGMGMMTGIELEDDNAKEVMLKCAENGLLVLTAKKLIRLLPPLNIDEIDMNEGLDILEKSIAETRKNTEN